jgi:hypothetical protein
MQFLFAVIANRNERVHADAEEIQGINAFNEKIAASGQRICAVGLEDPALSVVFDNRNGSGTKALGPVVDAADFMAGLWLIEASSESEAHQLAEEASRACNRRIEIRAVL